MTYFIKPEFYPDFPNGIFSNNLSPLLDAPDGLEFMRNLYKKDTLKFYSVRDELILRGIIFKTAYQNNFFPHFYIEESPYLKVTSNGELFKKIDFSLLGLPHFISHFNVKDDLFFNRIPLHGFIFLSKNISVEFISNVFNSAGFTIISERKINEENFNKKIDQIFVEKNFSTFRRFCKLNNYIYLSDLSIEKIEAFGNLRGVGKLTVDTVKIKYLTYTGEKQDEAKNVPSASPNIFDNKEDQEIIIRFANNYLTHGYAFSFDIYSDMQFDEDLSNLISKYKINNCTNLSFLLRKIIPSLKDNGNFLFLPESLIASAEEYIISIFKENLTRRELVDFLNSKGYSISGATGIIRKLLNFNHFFEVDTETLINRNSIIFEDKHKNALREYLEAEFADEKFLSISNLIGFRLKLPPLNIGQWTKHLILLFGKELGYTQIKTFSNYRYEKLILVKPDSEIKNYQELIYHLIKNKYTGSLHESEVSEYLSSIGIANSNINLKSTLLYSSLFSIDDLGWISLMPEPLKK